MLDKVKNLFLKDFWLKVIALLVALTIRITVSTAIHQEAELSSTTLNIGSARIFTRVPVLVISSAVDAKKYAVKPETVEVEIRGSVTMISRITERDVRVTVDLTDQSALRIGKQRVDVALPPGVMLVRVSPSFVEIVPTEN